MLFTEPPTVHVVGAGLAGSEAAWQLGRRGFRVLLYEMRPLRRTEAHETDDFAELVCSNTLGSLLPHTAPGVFKEELRALGSLIVAAAEDAWVPAGGALAVDRQRFSANVEGALRGLGTVEIRREEVLDLPGGPGEPVVIATGPLTAPALSERIRALCGGYDLYFYDAVAPIVDADTIEPGFGFWADRRGEQLDGDYLNLPMDRPTYEAFVDRLLAGEVTPTHDFEEERYFGGCQPVETIARSGRQSLRFGPMKPIGLQDPKTGRRPWAVVQLRRETRDGTAMNMVGFQTKLKYGAQQDVLRSIPGLGQAEFLRLGSVHRNTFLCTPKVLDRGLRALVDPRIRFAGQIVGCEGYTESSAMGLWAALQVVADLEGRVLAPPPRDTMLGALLDYLATAPAKRFQPMNVNFGLLPADLERTRGTDRKAFRIDVGQRCVQSLSAWAKEQGVDAVPPPFPGGDDARELTRVGPP